ncbi:MAG: hypothetical protein SXV54_16280, partial [Chloroflexota bacterium]|nr:hypothetical protein [Chloroflexota bacterium]
GDHNWIGGPTAVERNVIAGMLFASQDPENSPPDGIEVSGKHNTIQNNYIGKDANGDEVGVCGIGIYVNNMFNRFIDNDVAQTGLYALGIFGSGISLDAITLQGNTFEDVPSLIEFGPTVPINWTNFNAAKITNVAGTTVNGTAGDDSPCPYCQVELFLDDGDEYVEALRPITVVTATADGTWTATLTETLPPTRGLRTASTTQNFDVIPDFEIGTTTDFADLYPGDVTPPDPMPEPTPVPPPDIPLPTPLPTPEPPPTYGTTLVITTTQDPDTSLSYTCYGTYTGGYSPAPDEMCTLRRAIIEAGKVAPENRPVLVKFNIPTSDEGYTATLEAWRIELGGNLQPVKGGQVTIDGQTQNEIGGRTDGPPIIVELYAGDKIALGEIAGEDDNVVRGLALQEGYISLVGDRNIVENCWVGLEDDGQEIHYVSDNPTYSNYATIAGGSDNNLITGCVVATSIGIGIDLEGDDNVVVGNYVGTRADGTLPDIPEGDRCVPDTAVNWWTGAGIDISGDRNRIGGPTADERNIVAGMLSPSASSTPPEAMNIVGDYNLVQNNYIGKDANGQEVWFCGQAIDLGNTFNQVLSNTITTIVDTGWYAFGLWGWNIDATTLRGNTIENVYAIEYGPTVPDALELFSPAIAIISGTQVTGISDDDCPYCFVDIYLDDDDSDAEALAYLGYTTATVDGSWSFMLTEALTESQGLRTVSTVRNFGVIENFEAGTSSQFSMLFQQQPPTPPVSVTIITPTGELVVGEEYNFVASVSPVSATLPITYFWRATDQVSQTARGSVENDTSFNWDTAGSKGITVTVSNTYGSVTGTVSIEIEEPPAPQPLAGVTISGPSEGYTDTLYAFTVITTPPDATTPITYTWWPEPESGQSTAEATYTWPVTGVQTIAVTATNVLNTVTDTHAITIEATSFCTNVTGVDLSIVTTGDIYTDTNVQFSANIAPDDAGKPYLYTIDYGAGPGAQDTSGEDPLTFYHTFTTVGTHAVSVSVWNCGMTSMEAMTDSVSLEVVGVGFEVYLPLVLRDD